MKQRTKESLYNFLHNNSLTAYQNKALPHKLDELNSYFSFEITSGDLIFLLSDGVSDFISQDEFYSLINVNETPDNICSNVINHLKKKGYKILEKNFVSPFGEADIICLKNDEIVFVEVKTRQSEKFGLPREAVDIKKQENYRKIAN